MTDTCVYSLDPTVNTSEPVEKEWVQPRCLLGSHPTAPCRPASHRPLLVDISVAHSFRCVLRRHRNPAPYILPFTRPGSGINTSWQPTIHDNLKALYMPNTCTSTEHPYTQQRPLCYVTIVLAFLPIFVLQPKR